MNTALIILVYLAVGANLAARMHDAIEKAGATPTLRFTVTFAIVWPLVIAAALWISRSRA